MTKALCGNNPEFVKLMMKNGINMSEYLDVEKLEPHLVTFQKNNLVLI